MSSNYSVASCGMPYAKRRPTADLNKAYAFLSEPSFGEAARALADKLVDMGFEEDEALDNIEPVQHTLDFQRDLFSPQEKSEPIFSLYNPGNPRNPIRSQGGGARRLG